MRQTLGTVFVTFLRLGCTAFGGPVAHLAYFRKELVERRGWISPEIFSECVALTQLLPGPASSQTGMLLGWLLAGVPGAGTAWVAFTLPSATLMALIALAAVRIDPQSGLLHGVLAVAAAVVAVAIMGMRKTLAPDLTRQLFTAAITIALVSFPSPWLWPVAIAIGIVFGLIAVAPPPAPRAALDLRVPRTIGIVCLIGYAALTVIAFVASAGAPGILRVCGTLFAVGSTVFGGGHVVLPFLEATAVQRGLVDGTTLLGGYGAAQAMPGPLFTIASFVGASADGGRYGVGGAVLGTLAIFAPSFLLLPGIMPFYTALSRNATFRRAFAGAGAAVLGVLCAAFVSPILTSAVHDWKAAALALVAFFTLATNRVPAWIVVIGGALLGTLLHL